MEDIIKNTIRIDFSIYNSYNESFCGGVYDKRLGMTDNRLESCTLPTKPMKNPFKHH